MNLLRFSKPMGYHALSGSTLNHFLKDLENESYFAFPQANVIKDNESYKIELSVAGFSKEQIGIQYHDNLLIIKGTAEEKKDEKLAIPITLTAAHESMKKFEEIVGLDFVKAALKGSVVKMLKKQQEEKQMFSENAILLYGVRFMMCFVVKNHSPVVQERLA